MGACPQLPHDLEKNRAADPVVHGLGHHPVTEGLARALEAGHVTHRDPAVFPVPRSDVDIELLQGGNLGSVLHPLQADHADSPVREKHPAAQERELAHTADAAEAQETLLVDMRDDNADLIHVRGQHDPSAGPVAGAVDDEVPHAIHAAFRLPSRKEAGILQLRHDQIPHPGLVPRGTVAFRELPDGLLHGDPHFLTRPARGGIASRTSAMVRSKSLAFMMAAGEWM